MYFITSGLFQISLVDIGSIYKIRIEVTAMNDNELPYWGLLLVIFSV